MSPPNIFSYPYVPHTPELDGRHGGQKAKAIYHFRASYSHHVMPELDGRHGGQKAEALHPMHRHATHRSRGPEPDGRHGGLKAEGRS